MTQSIFRDDIFKGKVAFVVRASFAYRLHRCSLLLITHDSVSLDWWRKWYLPWHDKVSDRQSKSEVPDDLQTLWQQGIASTSVPMKS